MNSFYLSKEPDTFSVRSLKYGNLREEVIFIQETCDRDLRLCLQASRMPFDYWKNIFSVLQFSVLASSILLKKDDIACKEAAWSVLSTALDTIKNGIMVESFKANNFEKGFLNELKGDLELLAGEFHRSADSYCVASSCYEWLAVKDEEDYVLFPEVETMFLQCDYIWSNELSQFFADSYEFVRSFGKRIEAKQRMAAGTLGDMVKVSRSAAIQRTGNSIKE
jgi:hypothetical protein